MRRKKAKRKMTKVAKNELFLGKELCFKPDETHFVISEKWLVINNGKSGFSS